MELGAGIAPDYAAEAERVLGTTTRHEPTSRILQERVGDDPQVALAIERADYYRRQAVAALATYFTARDGIDIAADQAMEAHLAER